MYSKPSLSDGTEPVAGESAGELTADGTEEEADEEPAVVGNGRFTGDDWREAGAEGVPSEPLLWLPCMLLCLKRSWRALKPSSQPDEALNFSDGQPSELAMLSARSLIDWSEGCALPSAVKACSQTVSGSSSSRKRVMLKVNRVVKGQGLN